MAGMGIEEEGTTTSTEILNSSRIAVEEGIIGVERRIMEVGGERERRGLWRIGEDERGAGGVFEI